MSLRFLGTLIFFSVDCSPNLSIPPPPPRPGPHTADPTTMKLKKGKAMETLKAITARSVPCGSLTSSAENKS